MGQGLNVLTLYPADGDPKIVQPKQTDPYQAELAYFVDCVRTGKPATRATPADARIALAVALAARRALDLPSLSPILI